MSFLGNLKKAQKLLFSLDGKILQKGNRYYLHSDYLLNINQPPNSCFLIWSYLNLLIKVKLYTK